MWQWSAYIIPQWVNENNHFVSEIWVINPQRESKSVTEAGSTWTICCLDLRLAMPPD